MIIILHNGPKKELPASQSCDKHAFVYVCVRVFLCVCLHVRALLATNPLGNGRHGNREQALCVVEVANPVSLSHGDSLRHVAAIRPQMDVNVGFCVNGGQS